MRQLFRVLWILCMCGCSSVSTSALVVRDGTVSANAEASLIGGASNLAQSMQRVEQDQFVALAVLNKTNVCDLQKQIADARYAWAKAFALVDVAKVVHARLKKELATDPPNAAVIQVCVDELNGTLAKIYEEIEAGRKRIAERRN